MNNINELLEIIKQLGNAASIEEICEYFCNKSGLVFDCSYCSYIENTLNKNRDIVRKNSANNKWEPFASNTNCKCIYANDGQYYKKAREAMLKLFNRRVSSGSVWFENEFENIDIWFAKGSDGWENVLSSDGRILTEYKPNLTNEEIKDRQKIVSNSRLTFMFDRKQGYYFVGVFKNILSESNGKRTYELVDDKFIIPQNNFKKIIVCNIGYMKEYKGLDEYDNKISGAGSYTTTNNQGGEIFNFKQNDDGYVYGFVETNYNGGKANTGKVEFAKNIGLENIDPSATNDEFLDDVKVIFISKGEDQDRNVVVGYYDNATVYRKRQKGPNPFGYNFKCENKNAILIPENERYFEYPKTNIDDSYNFGRENISYPYKNKENKTTITLIENVLDYLNKLKTGTKDEFYIYLKSNEYTPGAITQYINSINQISTQLIGKYIDKKITEIFDVGTIQQLHDLMLNKESELYKINKKRKYTWSAALGKYADFLINNTSIEHRKK